MTDKKYCVYLHKVFDVVFYVGHGNHRRPYARCKYTRSTIWVNFTTRNPNYEIEVVATGLTKQEAITLEYELIGKYPNLINKVKRSPDAYPSREELTDAFTYDVTSPSKLISTRTGKHVGSIKTTNGKKYWMVSHRNRKLRVHRVIMILQGVDLSGFVVNHIDGDGLNNLLSNLEVCTQQENMQGVNTTGNSTLGIKYSSRNNCWIAYWQENCKQKSKSFSIRKYGEDAAKHLASEYRKMKTQSYYLRNVDATVKGVARDWKRVEMWLRPCHYVSPMHSWKGKREA